MMKITRIHICLTTLVFVLLMSRIAVGQSRIRESFNKDWKFFAGNLTEAKSPAFNDGNWRKLTLPHDWSIEGKFDEKNPAKPEGGGLPTGIGWYRKSFNSPVNYKNRLVTVEFDGVYKNAEVWINGHYLGKRPYGYSSFAYEFSPYLKAGRNSIAVKVDNSAQPDSRWYSGSGIYRNVWLTSAAKLSVAHWGTFVNASVKMTGNTLTKGDEALVKVKTDIQNQTGKAKTVTVLYSVYDASNQLVAQSKSHPFQIDTAGIVLMDSISFKKPKALVDLRSLSI